MTLRDEAPARLPQPPSLSPSGRRVFALAAVLLLAPACSPPPDAVPKAATGPSLQASLNLALAHQEKALALLGQARDSGEGREYQQALLHALAAQRLPLEGHDRLDPRGRGGFLGPSPAEGFALRWRSPAPWLGGPVPALA